MSIQALGHHGQLRALGRAGEATSDEVGFAHFLPPSLLTRLVDAGLFTSTPVLHELLDLTIEDIERQIGPLSSDEFDSLRVVSVSTDAEQLELDPHDVMSTPSASPVPLSPEASPGSSGEPETLAGPSSSHDVLPSA